MIKALFLVSCIATLSACGHESELDDILDRAEIHCKNEVFWHTPENSSLREKGTVACITGIFKRRQRYKNTEITNEVINDEKEWQKASLVQRYFEYSSEYKEKLEDCDRLKNQSCRKALMLMANIEYEEFYKSRNLDYKAVNRAFRRAGPHGSAYFEIPGLYREF